MYKTTALLLLVFATAPGASCQTESARSTWGTLTAPTMDPSKTAVTDNVDILRDRVHLKLVSGTIEFLKPANGVVFGAVFHGEGHLQVEPPNANEAHQLQLFTKQEKLSVAFTDATFCFTDNLLEEVAKQVKWRDGPTGDELYLKRQQEREDIGAEYLPKLFNSIMSGDLKRTAYFLADLKTRDKGWIEVRDDASQPEEIRIGRSADVGGFKIPDYWMLFPANGRDPRTAYQDPAAREDFLVTDNQISTTVTDAAELSATARITVQPRFDGQRVLVFSLDSNLRVASIKDAQGKAVEFEQARERKDRNESYGEYVAVILGEPTKNGQKLSFEFQYAGRRVVRKMGEGNYFCPSSGWYPTPFAAELGVDDFAFRSNFDLIFRNPKKFKLVATGNKISESIDGKELVTEWKSDKPLAVAGFAFGDYKVVTGKAGDIEVDVYANNQPDDLLRSIQEHFDSSIRDLASGSEGGHLSNGAVGNLTPAGLGKTINIETANTLQVFQNYFGPYPYKTLSVTSISGSYGQGWPGLLYLGWFTFLDSTQRHELGIRNQIEVSDFFRAHESSHQWWGHRVGWKSFHDQWLSEGFAEFSGLLYVQYRENMKESMTQFRLDKEKLFRTDMNGHRVEELGPIWMGRRIASSVTDGRSYQDLIYSKGGYVLQMIREQLIDPRSPDPDHFFKETMQDYCKTYENQNASTEDFKAIVEKHMTRNMDLDGNKKLDWFFNQYVYGTGIPHYDFHVTITATPDGKSSINGTLTRSGVPDSWKDVVPMYAHMGDKVIRIGSIAATHPTEQIKIAIPGKVDRLSIDEYEDVLGIVKQ